MIFLHHVVQCAVADEDLFKLLRHSDLPGVALLRAVDRLDEVWSGALLAVPTVPSKQAGSEAGSEAGPGPVSARLAYLKGALAASPRHWPHGLAILDEAIRLRGGECSRVVSLAPTVASFLFQSPTEAGARTGVKMADDDDDKHDWEFLMDDREDRKGFETRFEAFSSCPLPYLEASADEFFDSPEFSVYDDDDDEFQKVNPNIILLCA